MLQVLALVLVGLLAFNGWMYLQQPAMVFFPSRELVQTPADWGLAYEDVGFRSDDGVALHGWWIPAENPAATLLFLHGNAGNISHRGDSVAIFNRLGLNVLLFDYRGYGRSEGRPGETGLYRDAVAAWHWLVSRQGIAPRDIIVFGRSLGGVVATRLAAEVAPRALIVESTFSSARAVSDRVLSRLARLVWLRYAFDAVTPMRAVTCPVLVAHSPDDEIIPYALGREVFAAAREPKHFLEMRGDHNNGFLLSQPDYELGLRAFLDSLAVGMREVETTGSRVQAAVAVTKK